MDSNMAQVEPLPFVPATVITGQVKRNCIRCATVRTRSNPISMVEGCSRSQYVSQSASVVGGVSCSIASIRGLSPQSSGRYQCCAGSLGGFAVKFCFTCTNKRPFPSMRHTRRVPAVPPISCRISAGIVVFPLDAMVDSAM